MLSAARYYLNASGAVAITDLNGVAIGTWWLPRNMERKVIRTAQQLLGANATTKPKAIEAINAAAMFHRVQLTPNQIAIDRARLAADELERYLQGGLLRTFNAEYARRRKAGLTSLSFRRARARFQRLLIQRLSGGAHRMPPSGVAAFLDEVFR